MESGLGKAKRMLTQDTPSNFRRSRAVPATSPSRLRLMRTSKGLHHYYKREINFGLIERLNQVVEQYLQVHVGQAAEQPEQLEQPSRA